MNPLIWVGSELGSLKSIVFSNGAVKNYTDLMELERSKAPCKINWGDNDETKILVGTKDGCVRTFKLGDENFDDLIHDCGDSEVTGVSFYGEKIMSCTEKGNFAIFRENEKILEKTIGDHIQIMKRNPESHNFIAAGGKENNLKVYDLEKMEKPIFAAKNVRNDKLDLRQAVWVTDLGFLKGDGGNSSIVTGTGDHCIKIYDPRKQKRPVVDIKWNDYPITSLSVANDDNVVIVGNTAGYMASIDLRKACATGNFKGISGSIRSVQCHKSQDFVACCGLDRFLRLYDIKTRNLIRKAYLKTRLNCVLLSDSVYNENISDKLGTEAVNVNAENSDDGKSDGHNDNDDMIWEKMEKTTDESVKRSKKTEKEEKIVKKKKVK